MRIQSVARPVLAVIILTMLPALSCTVAPPETSKRGSAPGGSSEALFARIGAAYDSTNYAGTVVNAKALIAEDPSYAKLDQVYLMAARSAQSLARYDEAAAFARFIPERFPASPHVAEARLIQAECLLRLGRYLESAEFATQVLLDKPGEEIAGRATAVQEEAAAHLSPGEAEALITKYPAAPVGKDLALDVAMRAFASGEYDRAYSVLAELLYRFPQHPRAPEIRRLLKITSERRTAPAPPNTPVNPFTLGVIYPVTSKFSLYGRYFEQGVTLAVDQYNAAAVKPVTLVQADSKASPVESARAARKLILEDGVLAVVGGVLAVPTVTAAVEANAWGAPLLSPVVTGEELADVGDWIFQTTVPPEIEVTAIAKCAIDKLLVKRFAVLAPAVGDGNRLAGFFEREITTLGGTIVSKQFFEPRSTDFKEQLDEIAGSAPEALFIPASPEELINILPQVKFYDLQVRLLGLSEWNTDKLIRLASNEIEGALFPLKTYHGRDIAAYEQFLALHNEKIGGEVDPLTIAGYFGTRLILDAIGQGMADREGVREYLATELYSDARKKQAEAAALTILTVHNGTVTEFTPAQ